MVVFSRRLAMHLLFRNNCDYAQPGFKNIKIFETTPVPHFVPHSTAPVIAGAGIVMDVKKAD